MKKNSKLKQRMYHLVLYSLSPMQKGIQCYHSGIEYANKYSETKEYKQWAEVDKTVIILSGGTSNDGGVSGAAETGSMQKAIAQLRKNKIKHAIFREPDCNDTLTAVAFLVNEKVWDKETYPDYEMLNNPLIGLQKAHEEDWLEKFTNQELFLREFLQDFRLAN